MRWETNRTLLLELHDLAANVLRAQVQILTQLRELRKMTVVVAKPGDRAGALAELWQLRDQFEVTDPDLAAQLHAIYNKLVVAHPEGSDSD